MDGWAKTPSRGNPKTAEGLDKDLSYRIWIGKGAGREKEDAKKKLDGRGHREPRPLEGGKGERRGLGLWREMKRGTRQLP